MAELRALPDLTNRVLSPDAVTAIVDLDNQLRRAHAALVLARVAAHAAGAYMREKAGTAGEFGRVRAMGDHLNHITDITHTIENRHYDLMQTVSQIRERVLA